MISLESLLEQAASGFPYPPTPDLTPAVMKEVQSPAASPPVTPRRLALVAAALLVVLAGLMAVPQVRAAVLEVLHIGAVRIFLEEPAPSMPQATATATPQLQMPAAVPATTPWTAGLGEATTLVDAAGQAGFPLRLPTYPPDAGPPDQVYMANTSGPVVVLYWQEPDAPERLRFALFEIAPGAFFAKGEPQTFETTDVNGNRALWITGAHEIYDLTRSGGMSRIVEANVLIWEEDQVTFRLETWLDMDEALRIAKSLSADTRDQ